MGEQRGEERVKAELGERVEKLGEIVLEKSKVSEASRATFLFLGEEISGEAGIEQIIAGLKKMQEVVKLEAAREVVENLLSRTEEFREVYRGGDSVAILHEYESLKDAFRAGAEKLNEVYNSKIKETLAY